MHTILNHHLAKLSLELDKQPDEIKKLLNLISSSFDNYDQDKKLIERAFDITSKELTEINQELRDRATEIKKQKENVEALVLERTHDLSNEQARLKSSIESLPIGYILTNSENKILLINNTAKNFLKIIANKPDTNSDINTNILDIFNSFPTVSYINDKYKQVLYNAQTVQINELEINGNFFALYLTPVIKIENGQTIGVAILIENITNQKILDRSKDEFFSIASHELRTPLTAIRGFTSIILENSLDKITDDEVKTMIKDIHDSANRLISIVNDFLDVSRIEQGKISYKLEKVNPIEVLTQIENENNLILNEKNIKINILTNNFDIPDIYVDKVRFRQILTNLVANAIKFTNNGNIMISFKTDNDNLTVLVSDSGCGIPLENQKYLFHKFQQAQSNILTRETTSGTGLGLYISKILAKGMHGDIELVSSEVNTGSTFMVKMPVFSN